MGASTQTGRRAHGRWQIAETWGAGDPLWEGAPHYAACDSVMLFEPTAKGGLGIRPEWALLSAGIT